MTRATTKALVGCVLLSLAVAALGLDMDEVKRAVRDAERKLGPASATVTITPNPADTGEFNPQRLWGTFTWQIENGQPRWWQHFSEADVAPHRGARTVVADMREDQILWYEVFDQPATAGIGRLGKPGTNAAPMIGRSYLGHWLSKVLDAMRDATVTEHGDEVVVSGQYRGNVSLTFDRAKGWLATKMSYASPQDPGLVDEWTITKAVEGDGSWYVVEATSHFAFPSRSDLAGKDTTTSIVFSDLKTGKQAALKPYPKPTEGTLVAGQDVSVTYKLRPDGVLEFLEKRERPQRSVLAWNWLFVGSGAVLLLVCLSWLVLSKRRSPVSL